MVLSKVKKGHKVKIKSFQQGIEDKSLLNGLGIIPGDVIEILARSPLGCPISIKVGDRSFVALRKSQANLIEVDVI